jgi:error-prone DNA polymerase
VPAGETPASHLRGLTWAGAAARYPGGVPDGVRAQLGHELALVAELGYEPVRTIAEGLAELRSP